MNQIVKLAALSIVLPCILLISRSLSSVYGLSCHQRITSSRSQSNFVHWIKCLPTHRIKSSVKYELTSKSRISFSTQSELDRSSVITITPKKSKDSVPEAPQQNLNQTETRLTPQTLKLGLQQLIPFIQIAIPFFKEDEKARNSLIKVMALSLANSGIAVSFSFVVKDFYNALNVRNQPVFYEKIELYFALLVLAVPLAVYYRFSVDSLGLYWRESLTKRILTSYFTDNTFYVMETSKSIDNPDQRIADDIRRFTRTSLDFFLTIFSSILDVLSFSAILFNIYPGLFAAIIVYAGLGSFITSNIGKSLIQFNFEVLRREADFRFSLIRVRENAESIAFYARDDASLEQANLITQFDSVRDKRLDIINTQRNLETFSTAYRYLPNVLPSLIIAPLYFSNQVELGAISQSFGAFNHVLGDFSLIINRFESLSAFAAGITRLNTFLERVSRPGWLGEMAPTDDDASTRSTVDSFLESQSTFINATSTISLGIHSMDESLKIRSPILSCANLTLYAPDLSRILIGDIADMHESKLLSNRRGISLEVLAKDRILVVGPSGAGKSSFLRAIAGLWQRGSGSIQWNLPMGVSSNKAGESEKLDIFFLPQKPYNFQGTLKDQLMYPFVIKNRSADASHKIEIAEEGDNSFFLNILRRVKLEQLAARVGKGNENLGLDTVVDWSKVLSLGEQQRLAVARVLYHQPKVVVLDEATSALDLDSEAAMYEILDTMDVTYISVGHRPSLLKYHTKKLVLPGSGIDALMSDISGDDVALIGDSKLQ